MSFQVPTPEPVGGPMTGDVMEILRGYLGWQRWTLLNICAGLTGEQMAACAVESSDLSLLGLVRHLAKVERIWLRQRVAGQDIEALYGGAGDPTDFRDGVAGQAETAVDDLQREWAAADDAMADIPIDHEIVVHGDAMSVPMVYVHLIGEYARHNGHADLLREAIDGVTAR